MPLRNTHSVNLGPSQVQWAPEQLLESKNQEKVRTKGSTLVVFDCMILFISMNFILNPNGCLGEYGQDLYCYLSSNKHSVSLLVYGHGNSLRELRFN